MADVGNTVGTAGVIRWGFGGELVSDAKKSSAINFVGDTDWFKIKLVAGHFYDFDAISAGLPDTFMRIRDKNGVSLDFDDDSGTGLNSRIADFQATYSGVYFLSVGSAVTGSGTGGYTLNASRSFLSGKPADAAASDGFDFQGHGHHNRTGGGRHAKLVDEVGADWSDSDVTLVYGPDDSAFAASSIFDL